MMQLKRRIALLTACGALAGSPVASAQSRTEFVSVDRLAGALYRPDSGPAPHIAFVYVNGGSNAMTMASCPELAGRGFLVLCTTSRAESNIALQWEDVALDVRKNIEYLRAQPGITKVILYGHSGGGAVSSFYQAVAENGVSFCQDPKKLSRCSDALTGLPRADGVVFPDAHPGLGVMDLRGINPSIRVDPKDSGRLLVDATLDPYNSKNGFNPKGPSNYSAEFQQRYFSAQARRMNELIVLAQEKQARERQLGRLANPAADLMVIPGQGFPRSHLDEYDPAIVGITTSREPRRLLKNDGGIVTQLIRSVSVGSPEAVTSAPVVASVQRSTRFLSQGSVRATDAVEAIDFCSSNSVTVCNAGFIKVPVLFMPMGANNFIGDEERMYERSPSKDKEYIVVEGALHGGQACTKCETTPGQYANSMKNMLDYIRDWANKRF